MLDLSYVKLLLSSWKIYNVQFEGVVYQQIGYPMGTKCAPLIVDWFLFCYDRDFMSNLHKCKQYNIIDRFNETFRYLDDIFIIDNPELRNIFLVYIQRNFI